MIVANRTSYERVREMLAAWRNPLVVGTIDKCPSCGFDAKAFEAANSDYVPIPICCDYQRELLREWEAEEEREWQRRTRQRRTSGTEE